MRLVWLPASRSSKLTYIRLLAPAPGRQARLMAITRRSTIRDVAGHLSQALTDAGITAVLTGGGAVAIYSANKYQSYDIDDAGS